jgi:hypothetical protein
MALCRITGIVLGVDTRSGTKVYEDSGRSVDWSMTTARVLVAGEDVTPVLLDDKMLVPEKADAVDWLVRVSKAGAFVNVQVVGQWSEDHSLASA